MSRFGIRKRMRSALGMGRPKVQIIRYPVTYVLPDGEEITVEAEEYYSLLMASQALPAPIGTGRRAGGTCPDGRCALCRIEVIDPSGLNEMTDAERTSMQNLTDGKPHEGRAREPGPAATPTSRLACYAKITGPGARIQVLELFDYNSVRGDPNGT
jgi:ferredoxin